MTITSKLLLATLLLIPIQSDLITAMSTDQMTDVDAQKWYAVYKGCYLYVRDLEAEGCTNLEQVFDKMRVVRDKYGPSRTEEFKKIINPIFEKYQERELNQDTLSDLADDLYKISEDIKSYYES